MSERAPRPLPNPDDPVAGPFWKGARARRLTFQRCDRCGWLRWPPQPVCPQCLAPGGAWVDVGNGGTVWSFGVYDRALDPAFADEVPYNVALVQLDAGPRLITNIVGVRPEELRIGMRVVAAFEDVTPDVTLVRFRPAQERVGETPA